MSRRSTRVKAKASEDEENAKKSAAPFGLEWSDVTYYFYALDTPELEGSTKIAGFDMVSTRYTCIMTTQDHTLIVPKSGAKFPNGRNDWEWWDDSVPEKLKSLHEDGFKIVIWTNQGGIEKNKQKKSDITGKITDMSKEVC